MFEAARVKSRRLWSIKPASAPASGPTMTADFSSVHNHYERPVFEAVLRMAADYPYLVADSLPDVACVALNRLGSRYIRHSVDLTFYLTEKERSGMEQTIHDAVTFAFEFVQARIAMRARR
jgi:hypothetical protein